MQYGALRAPVPSRTKVRAAGGAKRKAEQCKCGAQEDGSDKAEFMAGHGMLKQGLASYSCWEQAEGCSRARGPGRLEGCPQPRQAPAANGVTTDGC